MCWKKRRKHMSFKWTLADFADFVNRNGGTVIVRSSSRMRMGEPETMPYKGLDGDLHFTVRQVAIREATREEYLAFPWPEKGDDAFADGGFFYEIGFD